MSFKNALNSTCGMDLILFFIWRRIKGKYRSKTCRYGLIMVLKSKRNRKEKDCICMDRVLILNVVSIKI